MDNIETMELKISKFLRIGVVFSGIVITIGWVWSFKSAINPFLALQIYEPLNLVDSLQASFILQNWGKMVCYLGLGFLISLPVIRVFLSIILFIKQKEMIMAAIGTLVLLGLILSFSLGIET